MLRILTGLFAISTAVQGSAVAQPAPPPARVWNLEWQEDQCTISTGSPDTIGLSLWMAPGNPYAMIYLIGSSDALPDIGRWTVPVAFAPSGETFKANVSYPRGAVSHQRVLLLSNVGEKFPAAFAKASEPRLMTSRGPIVSPVTGANKAMDAMQLCMDDKLPLWGVDVAAYRALRTPPTYLSDDAWFSTRDDVPYDARVFAKSGRVVARLDMDATGRVA